MSNTSKKEAFVGDSTVSITGKNIHLTEGIKEHILSKLHKIDRYEISLGHIAVTIEVKKKHHELDIVLHCKNLTIRAESIREDLYISIDQCVKKLQRQICKYKTKIQSHRPKGANVPVKIYRSADFSHEESIQESDLQEDFTEESYSPPDIVKEEVLSVKTLTYEESIMKMELSGDAFMVFRSEEDQKIKIIYPEKEHHYGIIEPH